MNKKCILAIAIFLCVTTSAFANKNSLVPVHAAPVDRVWNRHVGFYMEAGVGTNAFYALLPTGDFGAMIGWGVPLAVGYNFLNNIALEAGFIYSSDLNEGVETAVVGVTVSASAAAKIYLPYLALRFLVPVGDRFAIIFKLGGMYPYGTVSLAGAVGGISQNGRISDDHLLPFTGIGATYAVTPRLDLNVMYQGAVYVLASGAVLSVGLTYHFS